MGADFSSYEQVSRSAQYEPGGQEAHPIHRASTRWNNPIVQDIKIVRRTAFREHRADFFERHSPPRQNAFFQKRKLELGDKRLP